MLFLDLPIGQPTGCLWCGDDVCADKQIEQKLTRKLRPQEFHRGMTTADYLQGCAAICSIHRLFSLTHALQSKLGQALATPVKSR